MGPLCRGGVLVPPHIKGALGIAAVPNQGRSLLPEARQGLVSLKAMRRDPLRRSLVLNSAGRASGCPQAGGQLWAGVPGGRGGSRLGLTLPRLCSHTQGLPAPPGPPGHAAPPRTECLEALCDPCDLTHALTGLHPSLCHLLPIPVTLPPVSFLLRLLPCDTRSDISPVSSYRVS